MIVRQGDLYWYDFGEPRGATPGYRRPVVVVQSDAFNATTLPTVLVCVLTGNVRLAGRVGNILLHKGEGGLPHDSVVNVTHVMTVDKAYLEEYIGSLPLTRLRELHAGLRLITDLTLSDDADLT